MRKPIALLILAAAMLISPAANAARPATNNGLLFSTEAAAKNHCPNDNLVWLNTGTRVYYFKGQHKFGKPPGAYVCKKDADAMGERESRSGH